MNKRQQSTFNLLYAEKLNVARYLADLSYMWRDKIGPKIVASGVKAKMWRD